MTNMRDHVARIHAKRAARLRDGMKFEDVVVKELDELHDAVNAERHARDNICCSMADVMRIEQTCAGHVDYAVKLGLRLQALVEDDDHE